MQDTQVKDVMKCDPVLVAPDDTLQDAARRMKECDCGVLPVGTEEKLEGMITDRDIVIRAICEGKDPKTEKVRHYMTTQVYTCGETESIKQAAQAMHENGVSRLVVKDNAGRTTGILSFGSILRKEDDQEEISQVVACATGKRAA